MKICKAALASGPMTTRELALHVIKTKGLDDRDKVLARIITARIIYALRYQWTQGLLVRLPKKRKGMCVWKLSPDKF
jgi:hypothetical protein